jgi:chromate reductase
MSTTHQVAIVVGSLRKDSINRKLANELVRLAPSSLAFSFVEIGELPLFNQDHETNPSPPVTVFKQAIKAADAVLFVTPEYNRSVPGVLKNAIDTGSRPYGQSAWTGKAGAIISASPGPMGGFGANHHLRQVLVSVGISAMAQPEAYIGSADKLFDENGTFNNEKSAEFLKKFLQSFTQWIERHGAA